ncbi:hypothetical protein EVAR_18407_1 [Eumeta japonica]|uniref:Uncharacterized protein n=1 Tax=Eumeta variegata TaxID=151549 RepID=A0A4C1UV80_EUMVA|nr:hypothetical protein EVAR_18407_1 [Eumeta japonica]
MVNELNAPQEIFTSKRYIVNLSANLNWFLTQLVVSDAEKNRGQSGAGTELAELLDDAADRRHVRHPSFALSHTNGSTIDELEIRECYSFLRNKSRERGCLRAEVCLRTEVCLGAEVCLRAEVWESSFHAAELTMVSTATRGGLSLRQTRHVPRGARVQRGARAEL